jgi:hypothetical protein
MKYVVLVVALTACADEASEPDVVEPLVTESTTGLEFSMAGFSGENFEFALSVPTATIAGYHVFERAAGAYCGATIATTPLRAGDVTTITARLAETTLVTLGDGRCTAVKRECETTSYDGDFVGVDVDGRRFTTHPCSCNTLAMSLDLKLAMIGAFDAVAGARVVHEYDGDYVPTAEPCE